MSEIERLRQAGFSDTEIADWSGRETSRLSAAGFSDDEISDWLGVRRPDPAGVEPSAMAAEASLMGVHASEPLPDSAGADERLLDRSPAGRALDAFGVGLKDGWGGAEPAISEDTISKFKEIGFDFSDAARRSLDPFKALVAEVGRGTAALFDLATRGFRSVLYSATGGAGQAAYEIGLAETPGRATRGMVSMGETALILSGVVPLQPKPGRASARETPRVEPEMARQPAMATAEGIPPIARTSAPPLSESVRPVVNQAGDLDPYYLKYVNSSDDALKLSKDIVDSPNFNPKSRGPVTWADTEALAAETGINAETLAARGVNQAFNAEQIHATITTVRAARDETVDLARRVRAGDNGDATLLKYAEAEARYLTVMEQLPGVLGEAGRALNILRKFSSETKEAAVMAEAVRGAGGKETLAGRARKVAEINDPGKLANMLREAYKPTWKDRFFEVWYNWGLLSNPITHSANMISNTAVQLWESAGVSNAAAVVGATRRVLTGADDGVRFGEAGAQLFGIVQGAKDGVRAAWTAFRTEIPSTPATTLERPFTRAIPSAKFEVFGKEAEIGGKQVRLVSRLLMAEDEVFRAMGARAQLNAIGYRTAAEEGYTGAAFYRRIAEIVNSPTPELLDQASAEGAKRIFANPLGASGQNVQSFVNRHFAARIVMPFVRTPTNIVKYARDQSPLGLFAQEVRDNIRGVHGKAAQDEQIARMVLGTSVLVALASYASDGTITGGGPTDPAERAVKMLDGWRPYSVRFGDHYYDYKRALGPFGIMLGVTADVVDVRGAIAEGKEADKIAALLGASVTKNLLQQTWLQGPSALVEALSDPDRHGDRYVQNLVAGLTTPGLAANVARVDDPFLREVNSIVDAIKARTPGKSEELAYKIDIWGNPLVRDEKAGPANLSPVAAARIQKDPVNQELIALEIWPGKVERKIAGVELNPEQYEYYQVVAGQLARYSVEAMVLSPGWTDVAPFARREVLTDLIRNARRTAQQYVKMRYPAVLTDAFDAKKEQIDSATGKRPGKRAKAVD